MSERPADLARLLRDTWAAVEEAMTVELDAGGRAGLRPAHLPVLRVINADGPSRISTIAREVGVSRQAVAQTVAPLVESGLLEVAPDPTDGRAKLLGYSAWGREKYDESLRIYDAIEGRYLARAGSRRAAGLRAELAELRAAAEDYGERGTGRPASAR